MVKPWQQAMRLPDFLGSYDYAQLYNEAMVNDLGPGSEVYSPADLEAYKNGTDKYRYPNVNWYNQLLRTLSPTMICRQEVVPMSYDTSFC